MATSLQDPGYDTQEIARALQLDEERIRQALFDERSGTPTHEQVDRRMRAESDIRRSAWGLGRKVIYFKYRRECEEGHKDIDEGLVDIMIRSVAMFYRRPTNTAA